MLPLVKNANPDELLIVIVASASGIFILILSIHLLYHLFFKLGSMNRLMKWCCVIFSIAYIPMTITNVLTETEPEQKRRKWLIIMNISYDAINVSLYVIIVLRFYSTFHHTMYQPQKTVYVFLYSLIATYFLCYAAWFTAYSNYIYKISKGRSVQIIIISEAAMLVIDIILSATITYLFCKNLFKLTLSMSTNNSMTTARTYDSNKVTPYAHNIISPHIQPQNAPNTPNKHEISPHIVATPQRVREESEFEAYDDEKTEITLTNYEETSEYVSPRLKSRQSNNSAILSLSIKTSLMLTASAYYTKDKSAHNLKQRSESYSHTSTLDYKQQQLIAVATRLMILSVPAIITTTLVWSISLIAWMAMYSENKQLYTPMRYVLHVFILPIDGITNFLCVYLNFKFSRTFYNRLCCGINRFCENCWAIITELKLQDLELRKANLAEPVL